MHFKRGGTGDKRGDNNVDIPDMYPLVLLPGEDAAWSQRSCFKRRDTAQRAGQRFQNVYYIAIIIAFYACNKTWLFLIRSNLRRLQSIIKKNGQATKSGC